MGSKGRNKTFRKRTAKGLTTHYCVRQFKWDIWHFALSQVKVKGSEVASSQALVCGVVDHLTAATCEPSGSSLVNHTQCCEEELTHTMPQPASHKTHIKHMLTQSNSLLDNSKQHGHYFLFLIWPLVRSMFLFKPITFYLSQIIVYSGK